MSTAHVMKDVHIPYTILLNFGHLGIPLFMILFVHLCLKAVTQIPVSSELEILKIPFIIIIANATVNLIKGYNPDIRLILKQKKVPRW